MSLGFRAKVLHDSADIRELNLELVWDFWAGIRAAGVASHRLSRIVSRLPDTLKTLHLFTPVC